MRRHPGLCLVLAASLCAFAGPVRGGSAGFISVDYSLAAPMQANAIGFKMGSGWLWGGMHYAAEGDSRDELYMTQAGISLGLSDRVTLLGGLSLGVVRNCVEDVEPQIMEKRPEGLSRPCAAENLTSAVAMGGAGGYNLGIAYRLTEKLGALLMYDQFDNKPKGTDGLQGLLQFGLGYFPDWL